MHQIHLVRETLNFKQILKQLTLSIQTWLVLRCLLLISFNPHLVVRRHIPLPFPYSHAIRCIVLNPLPQQSCSLLQSAWKRWKDRELSDFSYIIRYLLQAKALSTLILLYSCGHWLFFGTDLINELDLEVFITDRLVRLADFINREKEEKKKFSR